MRREPLLHPLQRVHGEEEQALTLRAFGECKGLEASTCAILGATCEKRKLLSKEKSVFLPRSTAYFALET